MVTDKIFTEQEFYEHMMRFGQELANRLPTGCKVDVRGVPVQNALLGYDVIISLPRGLVAWNLELGNDGRVESTRIFL